MSGNNEPKGRGEDYASLGRTVLDDLRRTRLQRDYGREFKELFRFYLDEESRARLARLEARRGNPLHNLLWRVIIALWLLGQMLKSLLFKLSPARRIMLLVSLGLAVIGWFTVRLPHVAPFQTDLRIWGFTILLIILMLELKDKLLAKDEIQIARQVQIALLPRTHPELPGWSVWSYSRPANDVGGDLVDYIDLGGFRHGVVLGDVAGKGLGAALLSAKLQATLRALVPHAASLDDLGSRVNEIFFRDGLDNRFATLFYVELEYDSGQLRYLNAGHNPAFLIRRQQIDKLPASSYPLGMLLEASYEERSMELAPGEVLLVYSDGLTEAENDAGDEFGLGRVEAVLDQARGMPAAELGPHILREVEQFLGDASPQDDLSLIVIVRNRA